MSSRPRGRLMISIVVAFKLGPFLAPLTPAPAPLQIGLPQFYFLHGVPLLRTGTVRLFSIFKDP